MQLAQKGIGDRHHVGHVVGHQTGRAGDAGRQQAIGDGLGVHVGEIVSDRSWISAVLKSRHAACGAGPSRSPAGGWY